MEIKQFKIHGDSVIEYKTSPEINQKVVDAIIAWCEEYNQSGGESIHQTDDGNIYSPVLVSDIIDDILEFKYVDDDE